MVRGSITKALEVQINLSEFTNRYSHCYKCKLQASYRHDKASKVKWKKLTHLWIIYPEALQRSENSDESISGDEAIFYYSDVIIS